MCNLSDCGEGCRRKTASFTCQAIVGLHSWRLDYYISWEGKWRRNAVQAVINCCEPMPRFCGTCGHNFVQVTYVRRKARTHPRPTLQLSDSSQPPASPHGAGDYSGLHPEDQPYLSSFMVA